MLKLARRTRGHFVTLIEIRVHLIRVKPGHTLYLILSSGHSTINGDEADVTRMVFYWIFKQNIPFWSSIMEPQFDKQHKLFNIFNATCRCLCTPGPWRVTSEPSAHALMKQCCVNLAKRVQHRATSKLLHENFDHFQI